MCIRDRHYVNNMMKVKSALTTRDLSHVYFIDDGFAVGISYFLKILNQSEKFSGLNWFDSVIGQFEKEKASVKSVGSTENSIRMRKAESYKTEFEWLFYSYVAAQQLLKTD
eukprot:TRINITY_DN7321_c0_g1_i5.p1 TRINITY_DN7321_c0_g1~~TRINITY_DN7321_c0_g1_i5.p1  ORF type:complete len:111 (+),score=17.59 TRINITY_DN7321_c0_g1_i5:149-481(+)